MGEVNRWLIKQKYKIHLYELNISFDSERMFYGCFRYTSTKLSWLGNVFEVGDVYGGMRCFFPESKNRRQHDVNKDNINNEDGVIYVAGNVTCTIDAFSS